MAEGCGIQGMSEYARDGRGYGWPSRLRSSSGFTLIELIIACSILLILTGIAVPQYAALANQMRSSSIAAQIVNDLTYARTQSQRSGVPFYLRTTGSSGVSYEIKRAAGFPVAPATDPVVRTVSLATRMPGFAFGLYGAATDPYGTVVSSATPSGPVAFNARGLPTDANGLVSQGVAYFVGYGGGDYRKVITVTGAGRVRLWNQNDPQVLAFLLR